MSVHNGIEMKKQHFENRSGNGIFHFLQCIGNVFTVFFLPRVYLVINSQKDQLGYDSLLCQNDCGSHLQYSAAGF